MNQLNLPREVKRAMHGPRSVPDSLCAVCGALAYIATQVQPDAPCLGWCHRHEPDAGWDASDGFGPLRDGTMTAAARVAGSGWTDDTLCEECGKHFKSNCPSCIARDAATP